MPLTPYTDEEKPIAGEPEEDFARKAQNKVYADARMVDEINALADLENASTTCTSTTSQSLTVGSKTFTVPAGLGWAAGMAGRAANTSSPTNYANFTVISYSGTSLQVDFFTGGIVGSGAGITTWTITKSSNAANTATLTSNTFTGAQNFAQGADIASAATVNLDTATGNTVRVTGNTQINAWTLSNGRQRTVIITGAPLLFYSATTNNLNSGGANYQCLGGEVLTISADTGVVRVVITKADGKPIFFRQSIEKRQTILSASVDTNGLPDFMSGVGSTTLTVNASVSEPVIATAANGSDASGEINRVGITTTNITLTGQNVNGTYYDYFDIAADGTLTIGTTTLVPTYRAGGADVITNGQFTFNYLAEMVGKVGNGSTAVQTYRVFFGEHVVAANVISSVTPYAIRGEYDSGYTATLVGVAATYNRNHNIGTDLTKSTEIIECTTTDGNYAVGSILENPQGSNATYAYDASINTGRLSTIIRRPSSSAYQVANATTGVAFVLTAASWKYKIIAERRF